MKTKIKLIDDRAELPERAHSSDTGYDIKVIDIKKWNNDVVFFRTGIQLCPPEGHYFEIYPRSSISKEPIELANSVGIIDEHYRGEILIAVRILNDNSYIRIKKANYILEEKPRLFQLILRRKLSTEFEIVNELNETERGAGGFGSTDHKK